MHILRLPATSKTHTTLACPVVQSVDLGKSLRHSASTDTGSVCDPGSTSSDECTIFDCLCFHHASPGGGDWGFMRLNFAGVTSRISSPASSDDDDCTSDSDPSEPLDELLTSMGSAAATANQSDRSVSLLTSAALSCGKSNLVTCLGCSCGVMGIKGTVPGAGGTGVRVKGSIWGQYCDLGASG